MTAEPEDDDLDFQLTKKKKKKSSKLANVDANEDENG